MRYIVRADSSPAIGSGHMMRVTAIAEELITRGESVILVGQFLDVPWLVERINTLGFSQILQNPEGFVSNPETDVLILDSYSLPVDDGFIQRSNWRRVIVIMDALTPAFKADLVIHPGITDDWMPKTDVKYLAGPRYIPFRKSIAKSINSSKNMGLLEILVVGGGTDPFNFVEAICMNLRNIEGQFHVQLFSNDLSLSKLDSRFTCVPIGPDLDVHGNSAQLVFTTASTTSLEFIAREVAVGIGCAVANQEEYYETLVSAGVAVPIGKFHQGKWELDMQKIVSLISSHQLREALKQKSAGLLDLRGVIRIADEIIEH
jgi:spore coat polysaccharide biosynthesis predicted glycosyltransferase SpsG